MKVLDVMMEMIESARSLDQFAEPVAKSVRTATDPTVVKNALSGSWLGHQLHPMLTDVPMGAWSMATLLDLASGRESAAAAQRLVGIGVLAAVPTALTGASDWSEEHGPPQRVGLVHAAANSVGTILQTVSWVARAKGHHRAGVLLSLAGLSAVGAGGYLGGHLSYVQGVGVNHTAFQQPEDQWSDLAAAADVEEGAALRAEADGVPVLVVKSGGAICVLSAICTHAGGPLDEGEITDGCVRCPWHGSTFSLSDGSVVRGPASVPQPAWEVKVENGRVLARPGGA